MPQEPYQIILGDCLEQMAKLPAGIVDMVLTDLPYGTTSNAWDSVIPMEKLWAEWKRVCKPGAPIVLFTQQPFTTTVAASNLKQLRTEWIWEKPQGTGFLNCHVYPLKNHENILVFCDKTPPYNPQKEYGHKTYKTGRRKGSSNYRPFDRVTETVNVDGSRYPKTVLEFKQDKGLHPTQKPLDLCEYLIRTYTNAGDTVLDCTMGSGTTIVAALNTGRKGIGIEQDQKYFDIAAQRCKETEANQTTLTSIPHEPDIIEEKAA
ncbi:site-specific DNA-methyltransferase [Granulicella mallensis]|uniref:Methyltransferase n=1 Tax=Granulicella mallensis TaxID=940614 RepID=A0A7W7ZU20_9BACT|nr:site-specific DNA-methyltransferase [Granulicella mallensis]MBB5066157.1 site-specific DNA-methyltransferase (adenine-specific) [Granulicella mallensis]